MKAYRISTEGRPNTPLLHAACRYFERTRDYSPFSTNMESLANKLYGLFYVDIRVNGDAVDWQPLTPEAELWLLMNMPPETRVLELS